MFSPVGYLAIKVVEDRARELQVPGFASADFHKQLTDLSGVFSVSASGVIIRQPPGVLVVGNDGEYVFLTRKTWTIDLTAVRDAAGKGNGLGIGVFILTFETDEAEYDPLMKTVNLEFADALVPFEGQPLVIKDEDAERLLGELAAIAAAPPKIKHDTAADEVQAYKDFVAEFVANGEKAKNDTHQKWATQNSISRKRWRELKAEHAPDSWKRPGAR